MYSKKKQTTIFKSSSLLGMIVTKKTLTKTTIKSCCNRETIQLPLGGFVNVHRYGTKQYNSVAMPFRFATYIFNTWQVIMNIYTYRLTSPFFHFIFSAERQKHVSHDLSDQFISLHECVVFSSHRIASSSFVTICISRLPPIWSDTYTCRHICAVQRENWKLTLTVNNILATDLICLLAILCLFLNLDLKLFLFTQGFTEHWSDLPPVPLKLLKYGAI